MNKKGFTLIELLAIITILAIIAVITVPQILNIVSDSKKETAKDSAFGYKNAIHQYYLTESANNSELDMNGDYSIENGVISNGAESFNIGITGQTPTSGEVTISNGEIVDGCIVYGDYSVVIVNGNVISTVDGDCYNYSYFTYDPDAEYYSHYTDDGIPNYGIEGNVTDKVSIPDPSWLYYVKEIEVPNRYVYGLYVFDDEEYHEVFPGVLDDTSCQQYIVDEEFSEYYDEFECRNIGTYKKYELCGVVEGEEFCLKLGEDNFAYNVATLNNLKNRYDSFDGIFANNNYQFISGDTLDNIEANEFDFFGIVWPYGVVIMTDSSQCEVYDIDRYNGREPQNHVEVLCDIGFPHITNR